MAKYITFLVSVSEGIHNGIFISAHNRIINYQKNGIRIQVLNVATYDTWLVKIVRRVFANNYVVQPMQKTFTYNGVKYLHVPIRESMLSSIFNRIGLIEVAFLLKSIQLRKYVNKATLIVAHWGLENGLIAFWINKLCKTKYYVVYHGSDIHTIPFDYPRWMRMIKLILRNSTGNIFVSNSLLATARAMEPNIGKSIVSANGIDTQIFFKHDNTSIRQKKLELGLEGLVFAYVGNYETVKNVLIVPKIFSVINKILNQPHSFVIVGSGSLKSELEREISKLEFNVTMTGQLPHESMPLIFSCIDMLILPSKEESFGMVLWEAISCGAKCVGTRIGGITEAIGLENTVPLNDDTIAAIANLAVENLSNIHIEYPEIISWNDVYREESKFIYGDNL